MMVRRGTEEWLTKTEKGKIDSCTYDIQMDGISSSSNYLLTTNNFWACLFGDIP